MPLPESFLQSTMSVTVTLTLILSVYSFGIDKPVFCSRECEIEKKVEAQLAQMTIDEELSFIGGIGFETQRNLRLGIPAIKMTDGPVGIVTYAYLDEDSSSQQNLETPTAFPASIAVAASWDVDRARQIGNALAIEAQWFGRNMLLGPCLNIHRTPLGGRNFESFGEDPYLTSQMASSYVRGVQSEPVIATPKHFALNNQESHRLALDVRVDERSMNEIYFPAFKASVEAGAGAMMAAYNQVNGWFAAENEYLLNDVLKKSWGFKGFVVSDWSATHSTLAALRFGLDLEMPWGMYFQPALIKSEMAFGLISKELIDDKVRRILRAIHTLGLTDKVSKSPLQKKQAEANKNRELALQTAQESIVLLKNQYHVLPLISGTFRKIAIFGPGGEFLPSGGGGSSFVKPHKALSDGSPFSALRARLNSNVDIKVLPSTSKDWTEVDRDAAKRLAASSDVALIFVGFNSEKESEGTDRKTLELSDAEKALIAIVSTVTPRTVVVINSGGPVMMSDWEAQVPGIIQAWYLGQFGAEAVSDVLLGIKNPSGKLPVTFFKRREDFSDFSGLGNVFPATNTKTSIPVSEIVRYNEGIMVGYRHADHAAIKPLFPFGHGLSYTQFRYDGVEAKIIKSPSESGRSAQLLLKVTVTNIGPIGGAEVIQVYVSPHQSKIFRPLQELKRFKKVLLQPGEKIEVALTLSLEDFNHFDSSTHSWTQTPGAFDVIVSRSSRDPIGRFRVLISNSLELVGRFNKYSMLERLGEKVLVPVGGVVNVE